MKTFDDKFGDGTHITTPQEGTRRQPRGFTRSQVLATALDPHTKMLYGVPEDEHHTVWDLVIHDAADMEVATVLHKRAAAAAAASAAELAAAATPATARKRSMSSDTAATTGSSAKRVARPTTGFMAHSAAAAAVEPSAEQRSSRATPELVNQVKAVVMLELEEFKKLPVLPMNVDGDVGKPVLCSLEWWSTRQLQFPKLAALARKVLGVPATSAPSERLFSVAGLTVTKQRNRLRDENVTLLVTLRSLWKPVAAWSAARDSSSGRAGSL